MSNWRWWLAHNHWITLRVFGRELHLCARCSGTVLGFICSKILLDLTALGSYSVSPFSGFIVSFLLFLPTILDWTTQSLALRQSNNELRLIAGSFEGIGVGILSLVDVPFYVKFITLTGLGLGVLSVGTFGRKATQKIVSRLRCPNVCG